MERKISYKSKNKLEKFGEKIYNLLVENFFRTFFVGGMVRDILLNKKVTDIDIATSALPNQVIATLAKEGITYDAVNMKFGNVIAKDGHSKIEITTFREELYKSSRYPKIAYVKEAKIDSSRRDFTINSLYLKPESGKILDFYTGFRDIKSKTIRFIGSPKKRITEDPLRIIRALRFALTLDFYLDKKTFLAIKNNFGLANNLTKTKREKEIGKLKNIKHKKILTEVINSPKMLDKYFKYR